MVLAMLLLGAWLWRRVTGLQGGGGGGLRIEASLAIGSRERLLVVRAGQRRLLLGVSPAGIVRLAALGSEDWPPPPLEGEVSFARLLAARLRREGRE
ncbi:MAG: hypothetical protein KatS3mg121_1423 [Gammaproteobacteria bacterium]|nr:MAG: hypothetical protein KatS3mg121_1423 [Gammaproteobacteria bacterium]